MRGNNNNNNNNNNKSTEVQQNKNQVNNNNYSWDAEVIYGNAATGEQIWLNSKVQSDTPITYEQMTKKWEEMDKEAKKLRNDYAGQVISAISYQDEVGNQVVRFTPTKELIFPVGVPVYDENGNQIVGKDNIRAEIEKRREEWARWEREGKLESVVNEIHHTDDGKTVSIKFKVAPKRLHPNEIKAGTDWIIEGAKKQRREQLGVEESQNLPNNENLRIEDRGNITSMEVDKQENIPVGTGQNPKINQENSDSRENSELLDDERLLTDEQLKELDEKKIKSLIKQLNEELNKRKNEQSSSSVQTSIYKLENNLAKAENALKSFQTSNTTTDIRKNDDKGSNVGGTVAVVGVISALAIGGVAFVKSKFSKNEKK